jgi:endonuclease/exonuclease/phosphatase family metal-dependent hydrolase
MPATYLAAFWLAVVCTSSPLPAERLTVLSYNIHHGEGTDGKVDLDRIARVIRDSGADLVALQEVDNRTTRTGGVDQTAELARLTGLHGRFARQIDYQGGTYGQAVLSRWPIDDLKIHLLPGEPEREQRIAAEARLSVEGRPMTFVTTHLNHQSEPNRIQQAERINAILAQTNMPAILAGDLNATPESAPLQILASAWTTATPEPRPSFPSEAPARQIDFVLTRPAGAFTVVESRVLDEPVASDHRPLRVVLDTAPAP